MGVVGRCGLCPKAALKKLAPMLLEAEAAVTSRCAGCYSTVASGLRR